MHKICLDAGHYATYNTSPCNYKYVESKQMWKLHLLLKKELERIGFDVITTRDNQEKDLGLQSRGKLSIGCDLFISLHSNAVANGKNEDIDYPVSYVTVDGTADEIGLKLAECVQKTIGTKQQERIEKRFSENNKGKNYYGVLKGSSTVKVPGIILEHSFHTNTRTTEWLLNDDNLEKLAHNEAHTIASYFGIETTYIPKATIISSSNKTDIKWAQERLTDKLKDSTGLARLLINKFKLECDGVYGNITKLYVLLYWNYLGWNKDSKNDGTAIGKKTIEELAK